jgi:hypothetical protein
MSDKALVRHLQRELAKLESELSSPRQALVVSDTTALLKEKDLQIEKVMRLFTSFNILSYVKTSCSMRAHLPNIFFVTTNFCITGSSFIPVNIFHDLS